MLLPPKRAVYVSTGGQPKSQKGIIQLDRPAQKKDNGTVVSPIKWCYFLVDARPGVWRS